MENPNIADIPITDMKRVIPIYLVDAFAGKPFTGNAAGVCYLMEPRSDAWMRNVAAELNQSETAFFSHRKDGFSLRWFTPSVEVDLCGHATLATAHILWETELAAPNETIRFHTKSGILTAKKTGEWIELDFPSDPPALVEAPPKLLEALGLSNAICMKGKFDYVVVLDSREEVLSQQPDMEMLVHMGVRGVAVTARGGKEGADFTSRFFAPGAGIPEDPVTGSIHCTLGSYWAEELGKKEMLAHQASARGGMVRIQMKGDRTLLRGQAITTLQGVLQIDDQL